MFEVEYESEEALFDYLNRLKVLPEQPSLAFLNKLIRAHQHTIPFENFTRICDFWEKPWKFSSLQDSLEQLASGQGSVCWSHARSFHWLLKQLRFDVCYLYMDPGHVCLKVILDQADYYVDVGYAAPFFEAKPLRESFEVISSSETFNYSVRGNEALVVRTPGPTKTLVMREAYGAEIEQYFVKGNIWKQNKFLCDTFIQVFRDEKVIKLSGQNFIDYRSGERVERELTKEEVEAVLVNDFAMDPEIYHRARRYLRFKQ